MTDCECDCCNEGCCDNKDVFVYLTNPTGGSTVPLSREQFDEVAREHPELGDAR